MTTTIYICAQGALDNDDDDDDDDDEEEKNLNSLNDPGERELGPFNEGPLLGSVLSLHD